MESVKRVRDDVDEDGNGKLASMLLLLLLLFGCCDIITSLRQSTYNYNT